MRGEIRLRFRQTCAAALAVCALAAGLRAGEGGPLERPDSGVLAILHMDSVQEFAGKAEGLLRQLNPHTSVGNPVLAAVRAALCNPSLEKVADNPWLEALRLEPSLAKGCPYVAAFPVADAGQYRKALGSFPGMREEGTIDDITVFKNATPDGELSYYLSVTAGRVALFGSCREAVRLARALYDNAPPGGFLRGGGADLLLRLRCGRATIVFEKDIATAATTLRDDVVRDLAGNGDPATHPLARVLDQGFGIVVELLQQTGVAEFSLRLDESELRFSAAAQFSRAGFAGATLAKATPQKLQLAAVFPDGCISLQDAALWPELWRGVLEGAGRVVSSGFGGVIDQDLVLRLESLLQEIAAAGPVETANGLFPSLAGFEGMGPLRASLTRFAHPEKLPGAAARLQTLLAEGGDARNLLAQNGINLKFAVTGLTEIAPGAEAAGCWLELGFPGRSGDSKGFSGGSESYLLALCDGVLAVVSSRRMEETGDEARAAGRRAELMGQLLKNLEQPRAGGWFGGQGLAALGGEKGLYLAAAEPLAYLKEAMLAAADWSSRVASERESAAARRFAREFASMRGSGQPLSICVKTTDDGAALTAILPRAALADLARACLDVGGAE